jgi:hypothetical protein
MTLFHQSQFSGDQRDFDIGKSANKKVDTGSDHGMWDIENIFTMLPKSVE